MKAFQFNTGHRYIATLIVIVVILAGAAGGVFFFQQQNTSLQLSTPSPTPTTRPQFSQLPEAPLATAKTTPFPTATTKAKLQPSPSPTPSPTPKSNAISASLGKEFTLRKNQVATITGTGLEVRVTQFINSTCPANAECFWSGQGLELEYRLGGKIEKGLNLTQAFGYTITIVKTDYTTYATLIVKK